MQRFSNLQLGHQLCFALYSATNAVLRAYRRRLASVGLTYTQYLVLLALWEEDGIPLKTLASRLGLDSASLTPVIKRLEKLGLLRRDRSEVDERRICIVLTESGQSLQESVADIQSSVEQQTGLQARDLVGLRSNLEDLTATMLASETEERHDATETEGDTMAPTSSSPPSPMPS
ncbi:MAG: MarR family transcriptional regulator [Pseudomonadota bacterium]